MTDESEKLAANHVSRYRSERDDLPKYPTGIHRFVVSVQHTKSGPRVQRKLPNKEMSDVDE